MGELIAALCYCAATSLTHLHTVRCGVLIGNGRRWGEGGGGEVWQSGGLIGVSNYGLILKSN